MDDAALQDAAAVRVAVRVRPLITRELLQGSKTCISTDGPCVTVGRDRRFTFDHAFGPNTQQEQVYREVVSPLVESCFDGFNVTVLAYGQTGSGKTFTMGTGECGGGGEEQQLLLQQQMGIAPRVIRHVFDGIEARRHAASFQVRAQFLEIYNEDVKDLLAPPAEQTTKWISRDPAPGAPANGGGGITLRDAGDGTILVVGAVEEAAQCAEDLAELLERGMALRATSSTCANEQSSRSHAILTIIIEQHLHPNSAGSGTGAGAQQLAGGAPDGTAASAASSAGGAPAAAGAGGPAEIRTAKLHLVDLAGSERTKQLRTSMQGPRFRETVNINQGLLALGNVISALGDERRRGSHVPYRESKLTRLLQDSLGGNSRTAMIACVSPADDVLEETLNTLKYANRAKNIRNKPVVNRALPSASPLRGAVQQMQLQVLQQLAAQLPDGLPLARGLPLAELLALDAADPAACLDVLGRMKSALAASGASSRATSMDGSHLAGMLGRQLLGATGFVTSPRSRLNPAAAAAAAGGGSWGGGGFAGPGSGGPEVEVEALVSGCSRAIAGILHGLAEMEAQGHINREAREHILRSLDASTLRLLPVVRSIGPRGSSAAPTPAPASPQRAAALGPASPHRATATTGPPPAWGEDGLLIARARSPDPSRGGADEPVAAAAAAAAERERAQERAQERERHQQLEERVRALEGELAGCRAELREAQEDLERDEIIFADKMRELAEAQAAGSELRQRLADAEERHAREVEELRSQVESAQAAATEAQQQLAAAAASRPAGWGPSRTASRGRLRRGSASGSGGSGFLLAAARRRGGPSVPFTTLRVGAGEGDGSIAAGGEEGGTSGGGAGMESVGSRRSGGGGDASGGAGGGGSEDGDGERGGEEDEVLYDEELLSYISETDYTEQHRREVLESDAALREELAEVLREKAAAEAERAVLERAALAQRSSFDEARAALEQQLNWLSGNIGMQQQQLQAAQAAEREARELAAKWQERAQELEAAIEAREEALRRLRSELEAVEGNAARSGEERAALRQQYEQRIAAVVTQVSSLQRQLQQHASAAATNDRRERQQSAERAAALEAELTRMRTQQAELKRQLAERVSRYERESAARVKELAALRKAAASARSRMASLEQENRAQRLLLRAKQQEVMAAEQRLRESQRGGGGGGGGGGTRSRSSSPGCRGYMGRGAGATEPSPGRQRGAPGPGQGPGQGSQGQAQRPWGGGRSSSLQQLEDIAAEELMLPSHNGNNGSTPRARSSRQQLHHEAAEAAATAPPGQPCEQGEQGAPEELGAWAEALLALVAEAAGVEARLEVLGARHRELVSRREALLREQSQFELRSRRRAEQLAQAVVACEAELADLVTRAADAESAAAADARAAGQGEEQSAEGAQEQQQPEGGGEAAGRLEALQQRMAEVAQARDVLQERARSGRLLDEREQQILDSLDDQLDDLETQLSYVAGELADRRAALTQLQRRREQLQQRAGDVGPAGLRAALAAAMEAVGHRAYQVRQLEAALAASEAGAARREAQLQFRLRESLVSLSAHIASLEATSPSSSVCLDSSELRNLLGIYLDRDLDPRDREREQPGHSAPPGGAAGPGSASALRAAQQQNRPQSSRLAGAVGAGSRPGSPAGPSGGSGGEGEEQQQPRDPRGRQQQQTAAADEPELVQAESLAVWGSNGPGTARRASGNLSAGPHQQQQIDSGDLSLQVQPTTAEPNAVAAADWYLSRAPSDARPQQLALNGTRPGGQAHGGNRSHSSNADGSSTSPRTAGTLGNQERAGAAGGAPGAGAGGGDVTATPGKAAPGGAGQSQPHPQSPHRRTGSGSGLGSGSNGGGAPASPTGGILRRTGSMDSVGSTGLNSGTTKRVTWSEHIATDPTTGPSPSPTRSAASGGLGFGVGGAGGGGPGAGVGRGHRERSILDRAGSFRSAAMTTAAPRKDVGNSGGGGAGGAAGGLGGAGAAAEEERIPSDHAAARLERSIDQLAGGVPGTGGLGGDRVDEPGDTTGRRRASDGGDGGGANGRGAAPLVSRSSVNSDDTVAAADAGANVTPDDGAAAAALDEAGSKGGVRSFNPWRGGGSDAEAATSKQLPTARELYGPHGEQLQQQQQPQQQQPDLLRISFETDCEWVQDGASSNQPSPRPAAGDDLQLSPPQLQQQQQQQYQLLQQQRDRDMDVDVEDLVLRVVSGGGGAGSGSAGPTGDDVDSCPAGAQPQQEQRQLQPPAPRWQSQEPEAAAFGNFLSDAGGAGSGSGGGASLARESAHGVLNSVRGTGTGGSGAAKTAAAAAADGAVSRGTTAVGYDSDEDELEEHVRLLEQAVSAAAAAAPPPPPPSSSRQRPPLPSHQGPTANVTSRGGWGGGGAASRQAAAVAGSFGYALVFSHESESDPDVYCVSPGPTPGPTPREPMAANKAAGQSQPRARGRLSLDRADAAAAAAAVAAAGASAGGGGGGVNRGPLARPNNSAPLPLPAPVRSISPTQHYGRLQRQKPWSGQGPTAAAPTPGPFTNPKPVGAITALSEALMPYKAHLKRSAGSAAGRADTPEGRRGGNANANANGGGGAGSGIKANFVSPQHPRYQASGAWPLGSSDDSGAATAASYQNHHQQTQQQQQQTQQPWRAFGTGQGMAGGVMDGPPYTARQDREDRQAAAAAAALRSAGRNSSRFVA